MSHTVRDDVRELKIEELDVHLLSDRELDGVAGGLQVVKHTDKASPKLFSDVVYPGKGHRIN